MLSKKFNKYKDMIQKVGERADNAPPPNELLLWENMEKNLRCFYAPFEHVNVSAKVVLVGITPGKTQMNRALSAAARAIKTEQNIDDAISGVKRVGSFSGAMRPNIIKILNKLGYAKKLGIPCSSELWGNRNDLVNFCSLLKYPVFISGKDYNGQINPFKIHQLSELLINGFVRDLHSLPENAEIIPLGDFVGNVLSQLEQMGLIPQKIKRVAGEVIAPPHPSGANAESIALLIRDKYPCLEEYQEEMYQAYLQKMAKNSKNNTQSEQRYKAARKRRWERISVVREAYGIAS